MPQLPNILGQEPLIEAVFELRLKDTSPLSDILPGFLHHVLEPKLTIKRLPAADIPQPMRAQDPNLEFAPLIQIEWTEYIIAIGDRNIVISCKLPYPKWPNFKSTILDICNHIAKVGIGGEVERFSLKYVNLIKAPTQAEQIQKIKMAVTLGEIEIIEDHINLQVHRVENNMIHIISVINGATGKFPDGNEVFGVIVDIDSIRNVEAISLEKFARNFEPDLETLRQANKVKFFGCLTQATIDSMEPRYE